MELYAWDTFTLLLAVSFLANGALGVVIMSIDSKAVPNRLCALTCLAIAHWAAMKLWMAFATTAATAAFHFKVSGISWCLLGPLFAHFVIVFVRKSHEKRFRAILAVLYTLAVLFFIALWTDLGMLAGMRRGPHGFTDVPGPTYVYGFQPYFVASFFLVIVQLATYIARAKGDDRARGLLVATGLTFPLVGGALTDMILPSFGIFVFELAVPLTTVNVAIFTYAMIRYRFLSLTVEHASSVIIQTMADCLLVLDPDKNIALVNPATVRLLGYEEGQLVGMHCGDVVHSDKFDRALQEGSTDVATLEVEFATKHAGRVPIDLSVSALTDAAGATIGYVCVGKDIRARKALMEQIKAAQDHLMDLAITDDLTGLFNRRFLMAKMREELLRARRFDEPFSVVLVDLDGFKEVNDEYGHDEGDRVLRRVANAFSITIRNVDTAARYGGDEFVLLLPRTAADEAVKVADRIRAAVAQGQSPGMGVRASVGVATYDPTHPAPDELYLFRQADWAMLEAKRLGKDRVVHAREAPEITAGGARPSTPVGP